MVAHPQPTQLEKSQSSTHQPYCHTFVNPLPSREPSSTLYQLCLRVSDFRQLVELSIQSQLALHLQLTIRVCYLILCLYVVCAGHVST